MSQRPLIRRVKWFIKHRRPDVAAKFKYFDPWYPTTPVQKLLPALDPNVTVTAHPLKMKAMFDLEPGTELRQLGVRVTKLFKFDRIELKKNQALETRLVAERLIIEAIRHGDRHRPTMELADFWLHEKGLVHKLFKVLVPRYADYPRAFTSIFFLAPKYEVSAKGQVDWKEREINRSAAYPSYNTQWSYLERAVLELKGNPLPPLRVPPPKNANILTNVLMSAARDDAYRRKNRQSEVHSEESSDSESDADTRTHIPQN